MRPRRVPQAGASRSWRVALGGTLLLIGMALTLASCALPDVAATTSSKAASSSSPVMPLPQNSSLVQPATHTQGGGQTWTYVIPNTDAAKVEAFYRSSLPPQGWTRYQTLFKTTGGGQSVTITAQRTVQTLTITTGPGAIGAVTPPAGGVILTIDVEPRGI